MTEVIRELILPQAMNGRSYRVMVGAPASKVPRSGARWIVVLDSDSYFSSVLDAVRSNGNAPDVCVIGVGYPKDASYIQECLRGFSDLPAAVLALAPHAQAAILSRFFDLTLPASDDELAQEYIPGAIRLTSNHVGGVDEFLRVIADDILPRVDDLVRLDWKEGAIFGHSLGGLAVITALYGMAPIYRTFLASSPSLWWNGWSIFRRDLADVTKARLCSGAIKVGLTVGEREEEASELDALDSGLDRDSLNSALGRFQMVRSLRRLAQKIGQQPGAESVNISHTIFCGMNHGLAPWCAIAHGIDLAFRGPRLTGQQFDC